MADASTIMWTYLTNMDISNLFIYALNYYFPYGMLFWLIGLAIFIIVNLKTRSLIYSTIPLAIYFVLISSVPGLIINAYSRMAMQYIGFILILVSGYYLYTIIKGG